MESHFRKRQDAKQIHGFMHESELCVIIESTEKQSVMKYTYMHLLLYLQNPLFRTLCFTNWNPGFLYVETGFFLSLDCDWFTNESCMSSGPIMDLNTPFTSLESMENMESIGNTNL